jgi:PKD repeat protein
LWDFGDGATSTEQNPSHIYAAAGNYTVKLTATNSANWSSNTSKSNFISIQAKPTAAFAGTPTAGYVPFAVAFTDQATGTPSPTSWLWDFGDGDTSTAQNPTHTYSAAGDYTVQLTATNACGSSTATQASYVRANVPLGNLALNKTAAASSVTSPYAPGLAVDGNTTTYWRSGNASKTSPNAWLRVDLGTAYNLSRGTVKWKENYYALRYRFQISNSGGSNDAEWTTVYTNSSGAAGTQDVTFSSPFAARYFRIRMDQNNKDNNQIFELECYAGATCIPPAANFSAATTSGNTPLTVAFTDQSTGSPTSWNWNFGDGGASTQQNPSHTFTAAGDYTVTLTVTGACGTASATKADYIHAGATCIPPAANFSAATTSGNTPLTVAFTDQSTGSPTSWNWNFGDGGASTQQNPSHTFNAAGDYTVTLTVTGACGTASASKVNYIHVDPCLPLAANFAASATSGNAPLTVNFTDQSTGGPTSWNWNFGNGAASTQQNPSHQFAAAGTYTVTMTAANSCNSATTAKTNYITVNSAPVTGNLARNKLATASSTASPYSPSLAVDGNATTYWRSGSVSSSAPNTWLRVDLGAPYSLSRGVVTWKENYFAAIYRLQISTTGGDSDNEWTTVYTNNSGKAGTQDVTFSSPFVARYFRIRMDKNNKGNNQILEFECYAGAAKPNAAAESGAPQSGAPKDFALEQNYPNPFSANGTFGKPSTRIAFSLKEAGQVQLAVYNMQGQEVRTLVSGDMNPGHYAVTWNGRDNSGRLAPSGVYLYKLRVNGFEETKKMTVMK